MLAAGVVPGQSAEGVESCLSLVRPPLSALLPKVASNDFAVALPALDPTALMLRRTPADLHAPVNARLV
jgi:hypothetical protein